MNNFQRSLFFIYLFAAVVVSLTSSCAFQQETAELIVHNANIYTLDDQAKQYEAMAVSNGRIIAMGAERDILNKYTADSVVDCQTMAVYPGFIDAHCHFLSYGKTLAHVDLVGTASFDEVIERVVVHAKNKKPGEVITGRGWDQNDWTEQYIQLNPQALDAVGGDTAQVIIPFPSREKLDSLFPQNPVVLRRIDGHALLANEAALRMAGIDREVAVEGGLMGAKDGKLTGIFIDNAMELIENSMPEDNRTQLAEALLAAQKDCFEVGLTTVDDAGLLLSEVQIIDSLQHTGLLKMRVYAMLSDDTTNFNYYLRHGIDTTDRLTVRAFKFYADGALGSRGACLKKPYADVVNASEYGFLLDSISHFKKYAKLLYDAGFQVCTHAIGDSANRVMLDVYAEVLKGVNDKRWRLEHAQVVDKADINQFAAYSIIPSIQPTHATSDMLWAEKRLGRTRLRSAYAYNDLKNQNGMVALGTDFPVENISPIETFYAAVVRKNAEGIPAEGFQLENALLREDALRGMTSWAAIANFEEKNKGTLEVGKFADFVVLDRDLLKVPVEKLRAATVMKTFVNGEQVFDRNPE